MSDFSEISDMPSPEMKPKNIEAAATFAAQKIITAADVAAVNAYKILANARNLYEENKRIFAEAYSNAQNAVKESLETPSVRETLINLQQVQEYGNRRISDAIIENTQGIGDYCSGDIAPEINVRHIERLTHAGIRGAADLAVAGANVILALASQSYSRFKESQNLSQTPRSPQTASQPSRPPSIMHSHKTKPDQYALIEFSVWKNMSMNRKIRSAYISSPDAEIAASTGKVES